MLQELRDRLVAPVPLDQLDQKDSPEMRAALDNQVTMANQGRQDRRVILAQQDLKVRLATSDLQAKKDPQEISDLLVNLEPWGAQDHRVQLDNQVLVDSQALQEGLDYQVRMARLVNPELQEITDLLEIPEHKELPDKTANLVRWELPDLSVILVQLGPMDSQDRLAHKVQQDSLETTVQLEVQDHQVLKGLQVQEETSELLDQQDYLEQVGNRDSREASVHRDPQERPEPLEQLDWLE